MDGVFFTSCLKVANTRELNFLPGASDNSGNHCGPFILSCFKLCESWGATTKVYTNFLVSMNQNLHKTRPERPQFPLRYLDLFIWRQSEHEPKRDNFVELRLLGFQVSGTKLKVCRVRLVPSLQWSFKLSIATVHKRSLARLKKASEETFTTLFRPF